MRVERWKVRDEGWKMRIERWGMRNVGWEMRVENEGWEMRGERWGLRWAWRDKHWETRVEGWGVRDEGCWHYHNGCILISVCVRSMLSGMVRRRVRFEGTLRLRAENIYMMGEGRGDGKWRQGMRSYKWGVQTEVLPLSMVASQFEYLWNPLGRYKTGCFNRWKASLW